MLSSSHRHRGIWSIVATKSRPREFGRRDISNQELRLSDRNSTNRELSFRIHAAQVRVTKRYAEDAA